MRDVDPEPVLRLVESANFHDAIACEAAFALPWPNSDVHPKPDRALIATSIFTAFPDCRFEIQALMIRSDAVMCEMTMTGTHLGTPALPVLGGQLVGLAPTGRHVSVHHMHLFRVDGARIAEHRGVRDDLAMMRQLGLLTKRPAPLPLVRG